VIQIEDTIVSWDIFEQKFCCDLAVCKGACCVEGDSGAPLEEKETERIRVNYERIRPYMTEAGVKVVEQQGFSVIDMEGDEVTPLIAGRECAYAIEENGNCWCAIEKAWLKGESDFRKPISCHLYPVRITKYRNYEAVNYNEWSICACARKRGVKEGIPLYVFLKDAFIARYGEEWYAQLCLAAKELESGRIKYRK